MSAEKKKLGNPSLVELLEKYKDSSVVAEIEKSVSLSNTLSVPISSLELHPLFDETNYDLKANSLSDSIRKNGIIFPLFVIVENDKRLVINGVKRFLIARSFDIPEVPIVILNIAFDDVIAYILQNEIKNGDNAFVKGTAYKVLITKYGFTEKDIRLLTGLSHGQVNNLMRILSLPKEAKQAVVSERLQYAQARVLLGLAKSEQLELMAKFEKDKISVREAERIAGSYKKSSYYHDDRVKLKRNGMTIEVRLDTPQEADELEAIIQEYLKRA